jgi:hypothetical protein
MNLHLVGANGLIYAKTIDQQSNQPRYKKEDVAR